jgi:hypothetical protein
MQNLSVQREERFRVAYYNRISGGQAEDITQIPGQALQLLSYLSYYDIIRPFVAENLQEGASVSILTNRYGVSRKYIETVKKKYQLEQ